MSSATNLHPLKISSLILAISSVIYTSNAVSQVSAPPPIDAGALQQGLERQLPLPSPLALPEPERNATGPSGETKEAEVRFTVSQFQLEGVKLLPEKEIQDLLKAWVGRPVTFNDLQSACDAIQSLYQKRGYTVQAILPPQKIADGKVKLSLLKQSWARSLSIPLKARLALLRSVQPPTLLMLMCLVSH